MTPALPPGRFRKAAVETWQQWWATEVAREWTPADVAAAERLIRVVNDFHKSKDPGERRRLTTTLRTGERDLGLHRRRARSDVRRSGPAPRARVGPSWYDMTLAEREASRQRRYDRLMDQREVEEADAIREGYASLAARELVPLDR